MSEVLLVNFRDLMRTWFYTKTEDESEFHDWLDDTIVLEDGILKICE